MERFLEIATRLQIDGVPYFTKTVSRSQMEIPAHFVRDYGKEMKPMATIRLGPGSKAWPVQICICYSRRFRVRFCNRWARFLSDNGVRDGDEMIISLVAMSEFVVYILKRKRNRGATSPSRYPISSAATSHSSDDDCLLAHVANTPNIEVEKMVSSNLSAPGVTAEMQGRNISDNSIARPVGIDPERCTDKFEERMVATETHADIPESSSNGAISFQKRMSEASIGHFGNPQFARTEIPAGFVRRYGRLFAEGTVVTLEGPKRGTKSQVACHVKESSHRRTMWRRGWPNFVTQNELKRGDTLDFILTGPNRFSVQFTDKKISWTGHQDPSKNARLNVKNSRNKKRPPAQMGAKNYSTGLPPQSVNQSEAVNGSEPANRNEAANPHFVKTLPATSVAGCTPYPFLSIPASFWHSVRLPPEVNLLGPNDDAVFPVRWSGDVTVGSTKNLTSGWRAFARSNSLEVGDRLRFTFVRKSKLFVAEYV